MEFDTKGILTWNQNRCPNLSKINAKTGYGNDHENHQNHVSLNGKVIQIHCKNNSVFEDLASCVRQRKRYQTNTVNDIEVHPQFYEKSMQNVCSKK